MAVMFHRDDLPPEEARVLSLTEAASLGYHISLRGSHLLLRCLYSSPLSYFVKVLRYDILYSTDKACIFSVKVLLSVFYWMLCVGVFSQERGVDVEIVRATILYRLQSNFLAVDITVACALS